MAKRILVCGGRDFANLAQIARHTEEWETKRKEYRWVHRMLDSLFPTTDDESTWLPNAFVIAGAANGVDSCAIDWAVVNWLPFKEYPADWKQYGKRAGYIRNIQMLEEGKPHLVVVFPGGKGTAMMKNLAEKAGVEVKEFVYNG